MRNRYRLHLSRGHRILFQIITTGLICFFQLVDGASIRCCSFANGSCRSTCEQISLVKLATDPTELEISLQKLTGYCQKPHMYSFWSCMNETLEEISRGTGWLGRPCCDLPQSEKCARACLQAQSLLDLSSSCRKSDEIVFYNCIERQEAGEQCCSNAKTESCLETCKIVFGSSFTPPLPVREAVQKHCLENNPQIEECIEPYIKVTPAEHPHKTLHCCDNSPDFHCRTSCIETLLTIDNYQEQADALVKVCGPPLPQDDMWQCLLRLAPPNNSPREPGGSLIQSEKVGMDGAKLQCCHRAVTSHCQRLCREAFGNQWSSSKFIDFDRVCHYQLAESELIRCLTQVDEPCELGCEGLQYCTNFNFRPTELFRSCDRDSNNAAQKDMDLWEKDGWIKLPNVNIPVLKLSECYPEVWKAIACALQIKPCQKEAHVNSICKSDCIDILNKCLDRNRLNGNQSPLTLCEILSPPGNDTPCISISTYLDKSMHLETAPEITHPCVPNKCPKNQVCIVERNCVIGKPCQAYTCLPGCKMGEVSTFVVPHNSYVRLPSNTHDYPHCYMVCFCAGKSGLEDCMTPSCISTDNCFFEGSSYNHNTHFKSGCKTCFCYDGEITCSPLSCNSGLLCNCQDHYVPVCGANGKTYPSACLARCVGLTDNQFEFGACYDSDPCSPNSCHPYHRCVPKKRVCLSIRHRSCKQYDCVNMQNFCNEHIESPVCDTDNVEHPSICWMLQKRKILAYYGKCMSHCRGSGLVCGHNGETYASECAAWAERVSVDYKGACAAVGSRYGKNSHCGGIKCSPLPSEHCTKVFPPGSCCPICGAALRLLYSQKLSDWTVEAIRDVDPVVIQTIAEKFREHVKVIECEVFAYLSLESNIIVLVMSISDSPTKLQVAACVSEAEKLQVLIQQHSPSLLTELPLSFFTYATMIDPVTDSSTKLNFNLFNLFVTLNIALIYWHIQRVL